MSLDAAAAVVVAGIVGLCVGSFLNVVIHRLPRMLRRAWHEESAALLVEAKLPDAAAALRTWNDASADSAPLRAPGSREPVYNIAVPRSACPGCGHRISAAQNIPVLSWFVLRGKCSACGMRIAARYPAVELLGGVVAAYAVWRFGPTFKALAACGFLWTLIALTFIDFDTQLLPDDLTLPLLWAGLIANMFELFVPLKTAVLGAIAGYLALWTVYWIFRIVRGKEGMGYGDFKLLAALGAWLGWQMIPLVILLSSVVGAAIGLLLLVFKGRDHDIPLAFGPYLAIAGGIAMFFGPAILKAYLG